MINKKVKKLINKFDHAVKVFAVQLNYHIFHNFIWRKMNHFTTELEFDI